MCNHRKMDLVSNDPYGRSPGMDGFTRYQALQQEPDAKPKHRQSRQPTMLADVQLKNQPAPCSPVDYLHPRNDGNWQRWHGSSLWQLATRHSRHVRRPQGSPARIKETFFNNLFQTASQFETRSNIPPIEWNMRKSESLVMLGPVLERTHNEVLAPTIDRVWGLMLRAGIFPPRHLRSQERASTSNTSPCSQRPRTRPKPPPSNASSESRVTSPGSIQRHRQHRLRHGT